MRRPIPIAAAVVVALAALWLLPRPQTTPAPPDPPPRHLRGAGPTGDPAEPPAGPAAVETLRIAVAPSEALRPEEWADAWSPGFGDFVGADSVVAAGSDQAGAPTLAAWAQRLRRPPRLVRRALSATGLRPGQLGALYAPIWPRAAAVALVAEAGWVHEESWDHAGDLARADPGAPTRPEQAPPTALVDLAEVLARSDDDWVRRMATAQLLDQGSWLDAEPSQAEVLDLVARESEPEMLGLLATRGLSHWHPEPLRPGDDEALRRLVAIRPDLAPRVAAFASAAHFRAGDLDAAGAWLDALEAGASDAEEAGDRAAVTGMAGALRGALAVRGLGPAETWREGLQVVAHGCAEAGAGRYGASGTWGDAGWAWRWDRTDGFTTCVDRAAVPGAPPPPGQRVALEVELLPPWR